LKDELSISVDIHSMSTYFEEKRIKRRKKKMEGCVFQNSKIVEKNRGDTSISL
jgi:hypothetical protein